MGNIEFFEALRRAGLEVHSNEGKSVSIVDPKQHVDGEPRVIASFDLSQKRDLEDFYARLVSPALLAASARQHGNEEGTAQ